MMQEAWISSAVAAEAPAAAAAPAATTNTSTVIPADDMPEGPSPEASMGMSFVPLVLIFFIMYFLLIRPQQKRLRQHQELIGALKKGDRVVTGGGILGTIAKFEGEDIIVIEIAPNVKVRVARSSITEMVKEGTASSQSANDN
jgi:preprotein translocase subunit YajC